jgi:hypothetical protein
MPRDFMRSPDRTTSEKSLQLFELGARQSKQVHFKLDPTGLSRAGDVDDEPCPALYYWFPVKNDFDLVWGNLCARSAVVIVHRYKI